MNNSNHVGGCRKRRVDESVIRRISFLKLTLLPLGDKGKNPEAGAERETLHQGSSTWAGSSKENWWEEETHRGIIKEI